MAGVARIQLYLVETCYISRDLAPPADLPPVSLYRLVLLCDRPCDSGQAGGR
jgi:hypothetical protein